jgi:hypothetical protein
MKKVLLILFICALCAAALSPLSSAQRAGGGQAAGQPRAAAGTANSGSPSAASKATAAKAGAARQAQGQQQQPADDSGGVTPAGVRQNQSGRVESATSPTPKTTAAQTREKALLPSARYKLPADASERAYVLPDVDLSNAKRRPNQIGVDRATNLFVRGAGRLNRNADGSEILLLAVRSPGAVGVRVHLEDFDIPEGDEVYVYGAAPDGEVQGPYRGTGPFGDRELWSGTVAGDTAIVEYYAKGGASDFRVSEVAHIYEDPLSAVTPQPVLSCEVDASCSTNAEKNAVGRIVYQDNGSFVCTGTLLNDRNTSFTPFFLTARHCVSTQTVAQTVETYWFYQTTSCNSGVLRSDIAHSTSGSDLLVTSTAADSTLIKILGSLPGGVVFAGWDPGAKSTGLAVFGFHHPGGGLPPSTTSYLRRADGSIASTASSCSASGLTNGYQVDWSAGITEPGSSGSGLWYDNSGSHYLIGVDSCGPAAVDCNHNGNSYGLYGKFSDFYTQIQGYIDPSITAPTAGAATGVTSGGFTANWGSSAGATAYRLDVSTSSTFGSFVTGYHNLDVGNTLSRAVTGLSSSTTYYYRVRAYNGMGTSANSNVVSATTSAGGGSGLVINPTFDSSITNSPSSAAIQATINQAVAAYRSLYTDPVTVSILFRYATTEANGNALPAGVIARSNFVIYSNAWNSYINALKADAKSSNDTSANASLPTTALTTNIVVSSANGRAVGLNTPPAMFADGTVAAGGPYDGIVTLNSGEPLQFTRPPSANNYDALRSTEHEIDEVLGLGSYLPNGGSLRPQDLFSWSAPGTRNITSAGSRYFSINGGSTNIVGFNQSAGGDFGDWLSGACPQTTPYVQNAFSCTGQFSDITATSPEGVNLDVVGYDLGAGSCALSITSVSRKAGRTSGGQAVTLTGAFACLSTLSIGGTSVPWTYTSGTSSITFTTPAHAAGAVSIVLTPTSGGAVTKANAFAYLPTAFTDNALTAGVTQMKVQHVAELRQAVDSMRAVAGLPGAPWTDPTLVQFVTPIKAAHITELRTYLEDAASRLGFPAGSYTDPTLGSGSVIKRVHVEELRQRIRNIAG